MGEEAMIIYLAIAVLVAVGTSSFMQYKNIDDGDFALTVLGSILNGMLWPILWIPGLIFGGGKLIAMAARKLNDQKKK